jgi:hypothetical protein
VYSLISFEETNIPYAEIWELPGFNRGDNFMGLRFLSKDASATVLQGLRIETQTSDAADDAVERSLTQALSGAKIMDLEAINTATATYMRSGSVLVHRAEALLVAAYRESMPDVSFRRLRTAAGVTDLYVDGDAKVEIVEAKRAADHGYVRDALGQLLDYAAHSPQPVSRLTALFPRRLAEIDVQLLHRYGVDCAYRTGDGLFERWDAPGTNRNRMSEIWNYPARNSTVLA